MSAIEGNYFDGNYPIAVKAKVTFMDQEASLAAGFSLKNYQKNHLKVSPRICSSRRFITFPDGGQFECDDSSCLNLLPQESKFEGIVAWLEERWIIALACVALISLLFAVGYFFGLPAAAEHIAPRIPMETQRTIGIQTLTYLDDLEWLNKTNLTIDRQKKIVENFNLLHTDLPLNKYYRLEFRQGAVLGPNAIALPGGIIVITDEMVETAEEMDEILAVLAHEIGHVELHHTMRSVLQNSAIGVVVATVTSDAATLSAAVTGLPVLLAQTKYSRDFETEADDYAFRLLKQKGLSPEAFATLMERLANKNGNKVGPPSWVSTHPVTSKRINRARDAAAE